MKLAHEESIKAMHKFVKDLPSHSYDRALDVAGGNGRFSEGLLLKLYDRVDLFD